MILGMVDEAMASGARLKEACGIIDIDPRTLQRWRRQGTGEDRRAGPKSPPQNKLSSLERKKVLETANKPEYRNLSPKQIVPILADQGTFLASESTFYRILHEANQMKHRDASRPPQKRHKPDELLATGTDQVWSWDITYLKSPVRGMFYYLYMVMDVWSRKVMGAVVHETESSELSSDLIDDICAREGIQREGIVLHSDNGGPMKGSTMLATLDRLGITASFSRPRVSNDNPFSEAIFRTVKYRPEYPAGSFSSLEAAKDWVEWFVRWYNTEHLHSAISFVTPEERHSGKERQILENRKVVYERARKRNPERWSGRIRNWNPVEIVRLNPDMEAA